MEITGKFLELAHTWKLNMYSLLDKALLQSSVSCFLLHHMTRPITEIKTPKMAKQEMAQVSISLCWDFLPVVFACPLLGVTWINLVVSSGICVVPAWIGVGFCVVSFGAERSVFSSFWKILCHRTGRKTSMGQVLFV